jgi:predicted aspartyl protease
MSFSFDPRQGLVTVRAELFGPSGSAILRLALDTGATSTLINVGMIVSIGYDPALVSERLQVTTGSGIEFAPITKIGKFRALGLEQKDFSVLCHTLPTSAGVDGLLGLDFFRNQILLMDFREGKITLK